MTAMLCFEIQNRTIDLTPPKFAILISGRNIRDEEYAKRIAQGEVIEFPSLHVIGKQDSWVPPEASEILSQMFKEPQIEYHDGNHYVPTNSENRLMYRQFLNKFI
jgi:hypothetical protein